MIGPYVSSDGIAITGLSLTQSTFMLSKNGAAFVAKNETTAGSHRILGYYSAELNDTDTNAAGRLLIVSSAAAALPVWMHFTVLPQPQFDFYISPGSSALMDMRNASIFGVDMSSISPVATRAPMNALRVLRNRITTSGGVMGVYAENDSTVVWSASLTTNSSGDPIVEIDPAG
jgi:hypothetical protein